MIRRFKPILFGLGCWAMAADSAVAQSDLLAAWTFENSLAHGAAAPGVLALNVAEAGFSAGGSYTGDRITGAACREYPGNAVGSSNHPSTGSRVSFTINAAGSIPLTLSSVRWWSKARSFNTGATATHNSARLRLYWSADNFTNPVSPEINPITDTQLTDGSWVGPWVQVSAPFSPVTLAPGESITFRLVLWDSSSSSNHRLRLENFEVLGSIPGETSDEFDTLRGKWRNLLTGGPSLDPSNPEIAAKLLSLNQEATTWSDSLNRDPGRSHLWADKASTTISSHFNENYSRLRTMALAHATPGCALYQNESLRQDILGGIDWMRANRYFAGKSRYDNWWHWDIGAPQRLGDLLLLMHDHLGTTRLAENLGTLAFFVPGSGGWMTGANRSDKCLAAAVHGLLARRPDRLAAARDELTSVFPYVTTGDGFRTDGSFIQHTAIAYTGSYGAELLKGVARLYAVLQNTSWQLTDPQHETLFDWIDRGIAPLYFRGAMPDHVRGRAISRSGSTDHSIGHYMMRSILMIADAAPPARGSPIRAWLKQQVRSDTSRNFVADSPLTDYAAAHALLQDESFTTKSPPAAHLGFREMDRVIHRRAGFALGLSMSSSRVYAYESLNQENLRGWFTGDGMLTLHNHDLKQFEHDFWPTVDPYHLPGVTNPTAPRADASGERKFTGQDWVGGVTVSDFGSAGMRLRTWTGDLTARKSWFFFDDEVVCLGSDISGSSLSPVHTTIKNRRLSDPGDEVLVIDGSPVPDTLGWSETRSNPSWLTLEGSGGVWFPLPTTVHWKREARTGSWYDINRGQSNTPITRNYLTAWIDHGSQPAAADYAYVLLPDAGASTTASYAAAPDVEILSNTPAVQSVRDNSTGVTAAHFWDASGGAVGGISCGGPAAVAIRKSGASLDIAVSDPTWKRAAPLEIALHGISGVPMAIDPAITVISTSPDIVLSVAVVGARGRSISATFGMLAAADDFVSITPGSPVLLDVLANDSSPDGASIHLSAAGHAGNGQTAIRGNALFYQPDPGFTGADSLIYQIISGGSTASATVRIEVADHSGPAIPTAVQASAHDGNAPANAIDGDLNSHWSAPGGGEWIQFDFGAPRLLQAVSLAFHSGSPAPFSFDFAVSSDASSWVPILPSAVSSGTTDALERHDFPSPVFTRYLRVTGRGIDSSGSSSIREAVFHSIRHLPPLAPTITAATAETVAVMLDPFASFADPERLPGQSRLFDAGNAANSSTAISSGRILLTPHPGFVTSETIPYRTTDGHLVSEGEIHLHITRPTTLEGYLNSHFDAAEPEDSGQRSALADPDNDGLASAIEFLAGSSPLSPSPQAAMTLRPDSGSGWIWDLLIRSQPDGIPAIFTEGDAPAADVGGVRCTLEAGTSPGTWRDVPLTEVAPSEGLPPAPEGFSWHSFRLPAGPRAFVRMAATPLPPPP